MSAMAELYTDRFITISDPASRRRKVGSRNRRGLDGRLAKGDNRYLHFHPMRLSAEHQGADFAEMRG